MKIIKAILRSMPALLLCVGLVNSVAIAGVDRIYNYNDGSGWLTQTVRTDDVAAIVNDWNPNQLSLVYCATEPNGFNRSYKLGYGWVTQSSLTWQPPGYPVNNNTNTYVALARYTNNTFTFAAVAGGGLHRIYFVSWEGVNNRWLRESISPIGDVTHTYTVLADSGMPLNICYGVATGIGLERIYALDSSYPPNWGRELMSAATYVDIAASVMSTSSNVVYGVRSDGGMDKVYKSGSWVVEQMRPTGSGYVAVTDRPFSTDDCYAAKSGGGLDRVYLSGTWQTQAISSAEYVDIIADPCSSTIVYGAKKVGGIDRIYSSNGGTTWTTETISTGKKYTSIICQKNNQTTITYDVWTWPGGDISIYGLYPKCDALVGDINRDCQVDLGDIQLFSAEWLLSGL